MHPLDFAMQLELDGREFYLKQAELIEDEHLRQVFHELAADEEKHYQLLTQIKESGLYDYTASDILERVPSVFPQPEQGKLRAEEHSSYVTIYEQAIAFEEKAINLYSELASTAQSDLERDTFLMLEREEETHRSTLWKILQWLTLS